MIGQRHTTKCWSLSGECRLWLKVNLSMFLRFFMVPPTGCGCWLSKITGTTWLAFSLGMCMVGGV